MKDRKIDFYHGQHTLTNDQEIANGIYYRLLFDYYLRYFEYSAEIFNKIRSGYLDEFIFYLKQLEKLNKHVLLIGSGGGRDAVWISQTGFKVRLVDLSPEMIDFSKLMVPDLESATIGDANEYLKLAIRQKDRFRGVLNESSLQHMSHDQVYIHLKMIAQLLENRGILLIGLKQAPKNFKKGVVYSVTEGNYSRFFLCWTEEEINELLFYANTLGFKVEKEIITNHLASNFGTPAFIRLLLSLS